MRPELYFSVDIESSGPIPGKFSMLSLGACVVRNPKLTFYVELKPISKDFLPDAVKISGLSLNQLERHGKPARESMRAFRRWVENTAGDQNAVFVGFNASYDWQFVNWYLETFAGGNPFGYGGLDIKAYYMGLVGCSWDMTRSSKLPLKFRSKQKHTHNALSDAIEQADIFSKMLKASPRYGHI